MVGKQDDITLDFSFIGKLFSNNKTNSKKPKNQSNKYLNLVITLFLLIIPLTLSVYIRSIPTELGITEEWGRQSIYNYIRNDIASQINSQYPNLPPENKEPLINEEFNKQIAQNKAQIDQLALQQADGLKQRFKDESGETYLGDIDSYFWLRYARNIVEKGDIADERIEGVAYDMRMSAPDGRPLLSNLYPYIEAWLYKFVKIFNSSFSIMGAAYYTPMFLSFLAIIAAFLIGKKLSGNLAGLVASVLVTVNPTVLSRSLGSDNDIVNAVFPLLIMLFVFYAFDSKNNKFTAIYAAITGFLVGLYSFAWSGWWFMFLFIIIVCAAYLGYTIGRDILKNKNVFDNKKTTNTLILVGVFLVMSYISLSVFSDASMLLDVFTNPLRIVNLKAASHGIALWPNVYTTVAEMNSANMDQIISSLGGKLALVLALLGTIFNLIKFNSKNKYISYIYLGLSTLYFTIFDDLARSNAINLILLLVLISLPLVIGILLSLIFDYELDPIHSILMTIWFMATIYASTKGIRFILLIIPAFVISFSVVIGELVKKISDVLGSSLDMNAMIPKVIGAMIALMILIQPIKGGVETAQRYVPSINDAWVGTLTKIDNEAEPDAIINSWWDFGHWFKYWADRKVTFDGASQNKQQAHWIGKTLLTEDEDQAIAILRMLDCGGTKAEAEIYSIVKDTQKSVEITYKILSLSKDDARKELLKITNESHTKEILEYFYCEPPENYYITSGDMVGKSGVWAHFGSWNFERAKIYQYYKGNDVISFVESLKSELNYEDKEAQKLYYELSALSTDRDINDWIAPWPSYGGFASCSRRDNSTLICQLPPNIPMLINLTSNEAYTNANGELYRPNNLAYIEDGKFNVKDYEGNEIGYGIAILPDNRVLFMTPELTGSMFTRLFYYNGVGLEGFNKFHDVTDVTGSRIITWSVNWEK